MSKPVHQIKRLLVFMVLLGALLLLVMSQVPTNMYLVQPGVTVNLSDVVTVEEGMKDSEGSFLLTSVSSQQASIVNYILVRIFNPPEVELQSMSYRMPNNGNMNEYIDLMQQMMEESQLVAQAVALEKAGYPVHVQAEGVKVVRVLEESLAGDKIREGDVILAVDDQPVTIASEVLDLVQTRNIGDLIRARIQREDDTFTVEVPTIEHQEDPGRAAIGVLIQSHNLSYDLPLEVRIEMDNIVGPSAGVMFSLEILDQLREEDLTQGRIIAGTGTLSLDGIIGPISGIKHKIRAAERDGADLFLVPVENYEEVREFNTELEFIVMEDFDRLLHDIHGNRSVNYSRGPMETGGW